ncbi:MAG TPA: hypothetical protein VF427_12105 [Noviherbaspirillum sp.]
MNTYLLPAGDASGLVLVPPPMLDEPEVSPWLEVPPPMPDVPDDPAGAELLSLFL